MTGARKLKKVKTLQMEIARGINQLVTPSCVGVAENQAPEQLLNLALEKGFNHICQKTGHMFDSEIESSNCIIESAESFLTYPIATVLTPEDLSDQSERALISYESHFNCSDQKQGVLTELNKALQSKGLPQTIIEDIMSVGDEFFTNAIFNAPFIDLNTHKNPGVNRNSLEIKLNDGKFGRLFVAHDENRLIIGCQDPFGSLNLNRYLTKIRSTYQRGPAATMNFGPGGAGIGSYIIFNAGSSLYFGVWPGQATILCCVVPLGLSNRKRIELNKHVHWIQR